MSGSGRKHCRSGSQISAEGQARRTPPPLPCITTTQDIVVKRMKLSSAVQLQEESSQQTNFLGLQVRPLLGLRRSTGFANSPLRPPGLTSPFPGANRRVPEKKNSWKKSFNNILSSNIFSSNTKNVLSNTTSNQLSSSSEISSPLSLTSCKKSAISSTKSVAASIPSPSVCSGPCPTFFLKNISENREQYVNIGGENVLIEVLQTRMRDQRSTHNLYSSSVFFPGSRGAESALSTDSCLIARAVPSWMRSMSNVYVLRNETWLPPCRIA